MFYADRRTKVSLLRREVEQPYVRLRICRDIVKKLAIPAYERAADIYEGIRENFDRSPRFDVRKKDLPRGRINEPSTIGQPGGKGVVALNHDVVLVCFEGKVTDVALATLSYHSGEFLSIRGPIPRYEAISLVSRKLRRLLLILESGRIEKRRHAIEVNRKSVT